MSKQLAIAAAASVFAMAALTVFAPRIADTHSAQHGGTAAFQAELPGAPTLPAPPTFFD